MKLNPSVEVPNVEGLCKNCRWHGGGKQDGFPELMVRVPMDEGNILLTHENFGCVQFEAFRVFV